MALTPQEMVEAKKYVDGLKKSYQPQPVNGMNPHVQKALDNLKMKQSEQQGSLQGTMTGGQEDGDNKVLDFAENFARDFARSFLQTGARFITSASPIAKAIDPTGQLVKQVLP